MSESEIKIEESSIKSKTKASGLVHAAYLTNWSIYGRGYDIMTMFPKDKISMVIYSFMQISVETGEVSLSDPWADIQKKIDPSLPNPDVTPNVISGLIGALFKMKQTHRSIKVLASFGGWTYSPAYLTVIRDPTKRQKFVSSAVRMMLDFGFDGIDVDIEYPGSAGLVEGLPGDKEDYLKTMQMFRFSLDAIGSYHYYLTAAIPADPTKLAAGFDLPKLNLIMDYFFVMTYDFTGAWLPLGTPFASHTSLNPITPTSFSIVGSFDYLTKNGFSASKIIMGGAMYGRGATVSDASSAVDAIGKPITGFPQGPYEKGIDDYLNLMSKTNFNSYLDVKSSAAYLFDSSTKSIWGLDTKETIIAKCNWIKSHCGGIFYWELSGDSRSSGLPKLFDVSHTALGVIDSSLNNLSYPSSPYTNISNGSSVPVVPNPVPVVPNPVPVVPNPVPVVPSPVPSSIEAYLDSLSITFDGTQEQLNSYIKYLKSNK